MGTVAATPTATKSKVYKQVQADNVSVNFDNAAKFGVYISENGTARPGSESVNTTATLATTTHLCIATVGANYTITLPTLASVPDGHKITVFVVSRTAGTLTIDGNGAETITGTANKTTSTTGYVLRIKKVASVSTTDWQADTV
jgi:hypothetical protein